MSPILARAAVRAAGRRQFSIVSSMRGLARSIEPHPFERMPASGKTQAADWGKEARNVGGQALFYFPALTLLLGWPYLAKELVQGHVGAI